MRMTEAITPGWGVAPLRYLGGKSRRLRWFRQFFDLRSYTAYVEPYGGSGVVLLTLVCPERHLETIVYNDADAQIVNLMRALQSPVRFHALWHRLRYTLYAAHSIRDALDTQHDEDLFILHNMGMGGMRAEAESSFGRGFVTGAQIAATVSSHLGKRGLLPLCHMRLQRVRIHCANALDIIRQYDSPTTLLYCDPPYHPETRRAGEYTIEADVIHHWELLDTLLRVQGGVILSGYPHEDYQALETAGWKRIDLATACFAAARTRASQLRGLGNALKNAPRTECIWINPRHYQTLALT